MTTCSVCRQRVELNAAVIIGVCLDAEEGSPSDDVWGRVGVCIECQRKHARVAEDRVHRSNHDQHSGYRYRCAELV